MDKLVALLGTPLFALLCALIFAGLAAGGKFSVLMSQILFVLAAAVAILCFRIFEWPVALGLDLIAAGLLVLLAWWARPDTLSQLFRNASCPKRFRASVGERSYCRAAIRDRRLGQHINLRRPSRHAPL